MSCFVRFVTKYSAVPLYTPFYNTNFDVILHVQTVGTPKVFQNGNLERNDRITIMKDPAI